MARLDLNDHKLNLTLPGGFPLVLAIAMVTRANYEKTHVAMVLVPLAYGAQMLRGVEWKGWSVGWKS